MFEITYESCFLNTYIFQDIPPVNAFAPGSYVKRGFLMKLEVTQRPLGVHKKWLRRFCILTHSKLFVYEHEVIVPNFCPNDELSSTMS